MAICKLLHVNESPGKSSRLKGLIGYVLNGEKTEGEVLTGANNVQLEHALSQMLRTKEAFGKTGGRQAYHVIISFKENETDARTALEIAGRFCEEYLGDYEAVYAVHVNTNHVHAHVIFNSVSFVTGNKYHYKKKDWAKYVQPVINGLCEERGLSTIDVNASERHDAYLEWNDFRDGTFPWSDLIATDVDAAVSRAGDFEEFVRILAGQGYEVKRGMQLALKAPGMTRFRRTERLGGDYSEERIRERIATETPSSFRERTYDEAAEIVRAKMPKARRAKLSPIQKRHYAKLFRLGLLAARPGSANRASLGDVKQYQRLQEEYLFLVEGDIRDAGDAQRIRDEMMARKKELVSEKNRTCRTQKRMGDLFEARAEMERLQNGMEAFLSGDSEFEPEHQRWNELKEAIYAAGRTPDEVDAISAHCRERLPRLRAEIGDLSKKIRVADDVLKEAREFERTRETPDDEKKRDKRKDGPPR